MLLEDDKDEQLMQEDNLIERKERETVRG